MRSVLGLRASANRVPFTLSHLPYLLLEQWRFQILWLCLPFPFLFRETQSIDVHGEGDCNGVWRELSSGER